jgi:SAM-dependent methyltransferase
VSTKTVLHVGCGLPNPAKLHSSFRGAGWKEVRVDIDPAVKPDIVASIADLRVVPDASVDAVWSSHSLEHLYAHEVPLALREFRRVLKSGGFALITLPDLQQVAALIAADKLDEPAYVSPSGPVAPLDMLYGHRPLLAKGQHFMAHRTGFTRKTLGQALLSARFEMVRIWTDDQRNVWAAAYKNPSAELMEKARTQGEVPPEPQPRVKAPAKKRAQRPKRRRR